MDIPFRRYFLDTAMAGETVGKLAFTALAFIGIAVFQQVISVSATYIGENVAWTATNALRAGLARHCLTLDIAFTTTPAPAN